jgi:hypothetical protein
VTGPVIVVVLAADHPARDEWVDDRARDEGAVPVSDATYRGRWRLPVPERTLVHVFADDATAEQLAADGLERDDDA